MMLRLLLTGVIVAALVCGCGGGAGAPSREGIWLDPSYVTLSKGQTQDFTIGGNALSGITPIHLKWTVQGGSYVGGGVTIAYTAGYLPGSYRITVVDETQPGLSCSASVMIQ